MMDMMHSTTGIVVMVVFLFVVISGLFVTVRVVGQRARADEEASVRDQRAEGRG